MKKNLIIFLTLLTLFTSCNGQKTIGKPVNELGKQLWYVFQDTKNNYWFGSNGEGVYRYDGKTIVNFTNKRWTCKRHYKTNSRRQIWKYIYFNFRWYQQV
jgi:predicted small secreted protein